MKLILTALAWTLEASKHILLDLDGFEADGVWPFRRSKYPGRSSKMTLINTLDQGAKRGWTVTLNGSVVDDVRLLRIAHPSFGELNYGKTAPGYDGWSFAEVGGGGTVMVPFVKSSGKLYIGMVLQGRHNQGGEVWNVPRGFMNPGETHFRSMRQELTEELGMLSPDKHIKQLPGLYMNPNSAFFETPTKYDGVKFYSVEFMRKHMQPIKENDDLFFEVMPGILGPVSKTAELIVKCRFFPWRYATRVGDMFTVAGVARLFDSEFVGV